MDLCINFLYPKTKMNDSEAYVICTVRYYLLFLSAFIFDLLRVFLFLALILQSIWLDTKWSIREMRFSWWRSDLILNNQPKKLRK